MQVTITQSRNAGSGGDSSLLQALAEKPVLDPEIFGALHDMLDASVIAQIYREFLHQTRIRLTGLGTAPDPGKVREVAHTVKGTGGMLGAGQIAAWAEQLEHASAVTREAEQAIRQMLEGCAALEAILRTRQVAL